MKRRTARYRRRSRRPRTRRRGRKRTRVTRRTGGARKPGVQGARFRRNIYRALNRGPGGTTPPDLEPYIHWNVTGTGVVVTAKALANPHDQVFSTYGIGGKHRFLKNMNEAFTLQMEEVNGDRTYTSPFVKRGHPNMLSEQYALPHSEGTVLAPVPTPAPVIAPASPNRLEEEALPDLDEADLAGLFDHLDERPRPLSPAFIQ